MNNLEELTLKIKNIIESERAIHPEDIQYLNASHSALVAQIISSYNLKPSSEKMPQADMVVLGAPTGAGKDTLVRKIIMDKIIDKDFNSSQDFGILHHAEGIDLVPSSIELAVMEMKLLSVYIGREKILNTYLEMIKTQYDYIIIDCKPSLDIITLNALTAANGVLIPVQAQYYSAKGLEQLLNTIHQVITGGLNSSLTVDGILFTMTNDRTNNFRQIREIVRDTYGKTIHIFSSYIPRAVSAEEAPAAGMSIYQYDQEGTVSKAYLDFTCEFNDLSET